MNAPLLIADLFCGAGGSTSGAMRAVKAMGRRAEVVAVNHWDLAIATHTQNHPEARHHCVNLDAARPEDIVPEGRLDLLMASPECTHHSRARGGKPVIDQMRMSAWHVQRWASVLDVRAILVENVAEFREWGPVTASGRPDPAGKGKYFEAWIQSLWAMGYDVQWKLLNAADFGDATTRTRFFLQARKDGIAIRWPEPSHSRTGGDDLWGGQPRWRSAREVIDWQRPGGSLLDRKRPLSLKTRMRIARGLQRFGGELASLYIGLLDLPAEDAASFGCEASGEPAAFVSVFRNHVHARGMDDPLPTITASQGGGCMSLVAPTAKPFVLGQQSGSAPRGADKPLPTIAAAGAISVTEPLILPYYATGVARSLDAPMPTVTTRDRFGLCTPLVEPFLVPQFGERDGQAPRVQALDRPLPTVTGHGAGCLVEPMLVTTDQSGGAGLYCRPVDEPIATLTTKSNQAIAECVAVPATGDVDPRRLVSIDGVLHVLDIRFRMLSNRELARAMGFDDDGEYLFTGNAGQITRQIGNAVSVATAAALVTAILGQTEAVSEREEVAA